MKHDETEVEGLIHHFDYDPIKDDPELDEDGAPLFGWYWQLAEKESKKHLCGLYGPYETQEEAESACEDAWAKSDY